MAFASLDKRMMRDVNQIHDFLWDPSWAGDGKKLLADLEREGRELDAFLGAGGKLARHAKALVAMTRTDKERGGAALYELLFDTYNLTAATEHIRKKDHKGAAEHAAWVVESDSIGTCVALDWFPLVEEWEAGKIDFETYLGRLADLLEGKGVPQAGQYKRLLLATRTFGRSWDESASPGLQSLAARDAVASAAWCALASKTIRAKATGGKPAVPAEDFAAILQKITARL